MTHVACESKLHSVVRSYMHPCPGNWVAIRRAVVFYAWAAHAFSVEIKWLHCTLLPFLLLPILVPCLRRETDITQAVLATRIILGLYLPLFSLLLVPHAVFLSWDINFLLNWELFTFQATGTPCLPIYPPNLYHLPFLFQYCPLFLLLLLSETDLSQAVQTTCIPMASLSTLLPLITSLSSPFLVPGLASSYPS